MEYATRKRIARKLFKEQSLFAYQILRDSIGEQYLPANYMADIVPSKRRKYNNRKSPLRKYGRWQQIQKELKQYAETKNINHLITANKLRAEITKPYCVIAFGKKHYLDATLNYRLYQRVVYFSTASKSEIDFENKKAEIIKTKIK